MTVGIFHQALVATMPLLPRQLVWQFSRRYIAGTGLHDACRTAQELNKADCSATIDVLGEDSTTEAQIRAAIDLYLNAISEIHRQSLDCGISVKLSEMGLRFDVPRATAAIRTLVAAAHEHGLFVRIDMEDSSVTSITLDIYRELRQEFNNVGIVIQSCLHRSQQDVSEMLREGPTDVRLCKGIYIEPEDISYRDADDIRTSFQDLLLQILENDNARVGIATHDPELVACSEKMISDLSIDTKRYEYQMLLGVAGPLRRRLVAQGHPLRVYVPFGELWYKYSLRRLRENPNIATHVIRNLFRRT